MTSASRSKVLLMLVGRRSLRSSDPRSEAETSWRRRTTMKLKERPSEPNWSSMSPSMGRSEMRSRWKTAEEVIDVRESAKLVPRPDISKRISIYLCGDCSDAAHYLGSISTCQLVAQANGRLVGCRECKWVSDCLFNSLLSRTVIQSLRRSRLNLPAALKKDRNAFCETEEALV
jgi:hypothetical protein